MKGRFIFDDSTLPFGWAGGVELPLQAWISGVRPVLMLSYWVNYEYSGTDTFSYHFLNLLIHVLSAVLVFLATQKILQHVTPDLKRRVLLAGFSAIVFFVHPLQTESVAYIAGRSESLSGLFVLAAWCVFLYRKRPAIAWRESVLVLLLFVLAAGTKEHAIALILLLILTEYFWNQGSFFASVRSNWRLYAVLAAGAVAALVVVARVLERSGSAGFGVRQFTWYQYFFTEWRAIAGYARLFVLPIGQTIDHDFPISTSIWSNGALLYLIALAAAVALAFMYRKRYPLACFGFLVFLVLLAPTSSVVPVLDPFVERRMYLPMIGLLFVIADVLNRRPLQFATWKLAMASVIVVLSAASFVRAKVWADPWSVWTDAVRQTPNKSRPYWNLAEIATRENRCSDAIPYLSRADSLFPDDIAGLLAWAKVLECTGRPEAAMAKLQRAAKIAPSSGVFELQGLLYGEMGKLGLSKQALDLAVALDPSSATAYAARGVWFFGQNQFAAAAADFNKAVELNPRDQSSRHYLWLASTHLTSPTAPTLSSPTAPPPVSEHNCTKGRTQGPGCPGRS